MDEKPGRGFRRGAGTSEGSRSWRRRREITERGGSRAVSREEGQKEVKRKRKEEEERRERSGEKSKERKEGRSEETRRRYRSERQQLKLFVEPVDVEEGSFKEGSGGRVRKDRSRPRPKGEKKVEEKSSKVPSEVKKKEEGFGKQQGKYQLQLGKRGPSLQGEQEGEGHWHSNARCPHIPVGRGDAGESPDRIRAGVEFTRRGCTPHSSPLFPHPASALNVRGHSSRSPDVVDLDRYGPAGPNRREFGYCYPTAEGSGADGQRIRLQGSSAPGAVPSGIGFNGFVDGEERGYPGEQGGSKAAIPERQRRRHMERRMEGEWKRLLGKEGRRQEGLEERRRERRRPREELGRWRQEKVRTEVMSDDAMEGLDGRSWTPSPGSPLNSFDGALEESVDAATMSGAPERGAGDVRVGCGASVGHSQCQVVDAENPSDSPVMGGPDLYRNSEAEGSILFNDEERRFSRTFGDLSLMLNEAWTFFNKSGSLPPSRCKVKPTGKGGSLFPLPTSLPQEHVRQVLSKKERATVENICRALNSMAGVEVEATDLPPSRVQLRSVEYLIHQARMACAWSEKVDELDWDDFFRVKGVDYKGDEVLVARSTEWSNISPALPSEIGKVCLEDVVSHGLVDYVNNFDDFLVPEEDRVYVRPPKVMVPPESWEVLAKNLVDKGVCSIIGGKDVFRVQGRKLLNGLFGVSKQEFSGSVEIHRLIMNLIPLNKIVRGVDGDIATLPAWSSMTPLFLDDDQQLLVSSEDVRCFFYIFRTPPAWRKFMAFNRPLPKSLWPVDGDDSEYFLCADVLPMGFKNSVSVAQNIHRNIASWAGDRGGILGDSSCELRKDRAFPQGSSLYRLYLDNFDLLEKMDSRTAELLSGKPSVETLSLRAEYEEWGIPRHPKKSVVRSRVAEVQGALVDGEKGIVFPKTEKMLRYMMLGLRFSRSWSSTQKEAQVVGGGLVYVSLFRRPLLGGLNAIWRFISSFEGLPPVCKLEIPGEVKMEVVRFLSLIPLAMMNFRPLIDGRVTASDASTSGGGITVSRSLTNYGKEAAQGSLRGDIPGMECCSQVLTIGLFDGIGALRVAVDALGVMSIGHISVECSKSARRVVESFFPEVITVTDVSEVDEEMVRSWACKFTQASLVLLGAGPPCQGVSGLNSQRKGATRDRRSSLYFHLPRIRILVIKYFPWAQVHSLMESVASMDGSDRATMSESEGSLPWQVDAVGISLARRPRLYWLTWEVVEESEVSIYPPELNSGWEGYGTIELQGDLTTSLYLTPGWRKVSPDPFPTFTTSRPREHRGPRPAGLDKCSPSEVARWEEDHHRFPPYQYRECFCLCDKQGNLRYPSVSERELIMGFPLGYTARCLPKSESNTTKLQDERLTLLGNSWNVTVVVWLLGQLFGRLGLCEVPSPSRCVQLTAPGGDKKLQSLLLRPPLAPLPPKVCSSGDVEKALVKKLTGLISIKGEDILLSGSSDQQHRYHRLRASIPSKLWRWRTVCGWTWQGGKEHINVLELRAVLATLKWRIEKCLCFNTKFVHLTDSLVVLHALARGRSSSRKMRRTLVRANAYLLASNNVAVWTYVHTTLNPADKPSRRPVKRRWGK